MNTKHANAYLSAYIDDTAAYAITYVVLKSSAASRQNYTSVWATPRWRLKNLCEAFRCSPDAAHVIPSWHLWYNSNSDSKFYPAFVLAKHNSTSSKIVATADAPVMAGQRVTTSWGTYASWLDALHCVVNLLAFVGTLNLVHSFSLYGWLASPAPSSR